jgi:hypothetical protein
MIRYPVGYQVILNKYPVLGKNLVKNMAQVRLKNKFYGVIHISVKSGVPAQIVSLIVPDPTARLTPPDILLQADE